MNACDLNVKAVAVMFGSEHSWAKQVLQTIGVLEPVEMKGLVPDEWVGFFLRLIWYEEIM